MICHMLHHPVQKTKPAQFVDVLDINVVPAIKSTSTRLPHWKWGKTWFPIMSFLVHCPKSAVTKPCFTQWKTHGKYLSPFPLVQWESWSIDSASRIATPPKCVLSVQSLAGQCPLYLWMLLIYRWSCVFLCFLIQDNCVDLQVRGCMYWRIWGIWFHIKKSNSTTHPAGWAFITVWHSGYVSGWV